MSCPTPADLRKCDQKCRCTTGSCAGIAYACDSPCPEGAPFDPETCSCGTGGTWRATITLSGQLNPSNNGTRCFVAYFPEPYFTSEGDYVERIWVYALQPWPNYPGPESAFSVVDPNGPVAGYPTSPGGPPGIDRLLGGGGMTSICTLTADYCDNDGINGAGHSNGRVSWRNLVNGSYVTGGAAVPGSEVNFASCDDGRTGRITTTLQYLGPGEPTDYYDRTELGGDEGSKYRGIQDPNTGQAACFGPTKTP